ncbi:MAG: hypothetical protein IKB79_05020 [Oscillospiraceae bacterium]|nr:hypothetical protein [Oscillospiraceae bacterium]
MYIAYNGTNYPCQCRPSATMVYRGLPDDFPAPVSGEITLCADDDFVMRTDKAEDYLRQTFGGGVLTLTNEPEPVEPVTPVLTPAQQREEAYNTQPIIEWDGELLTVTQAAQKWQYYAAEGSARADELQALIAAAKQTIREQYPDEEAAE